MDFFKKGPNTQAKRIKEETEATKLLKLEIMKINDD